MKSKMSPRHVRSVPNTMLSFFFTTAELASVGTECRGSPRDPLVDLRPRAAVAVHLLFLLMRTLTLDTMLPIRSRSDPGSVYASSVSKPPCSYSCTLSLILYHTWVSYSITLCRNLFCFFFCCQHRPLLLFFLLLLLFSLSPFFFSLLIQMVVHMRSSQRLEPR